MRKVWRGSLKYPCCGHFFVWSRQFAESRYFVCLIPPLFPFLCSNALVDWEMFRDGLHNVREKERLFDEVTEFCMGHFVSLQCPKAAKVR